MEKNIINKRVDDLRWLVHAHEQASRELERIESEINRYVDEQPIKKDARHIIRYHGKEKIKSEPEEMERIMCSILKAQENVLKCYKPMICGKTIEKKS